MVFFNVSIHLFVYKLSENHEKCSLYFFSAQGGIFFVYLTIQEKKRKSMHSIKFSSTFPDGAVRSLTNKTDDRSDGQISSVELRCHAVSRLYLHCNVLIGRDAVGFSQLQHRGYSRIISTHTHHPAAIIKGLRVAGGKAIRMKLNSVTCLEV